MNKVTISLHHKVLLDILVHFGTLGSSPISKQILDSFTEANINDMILLAQYSSDFWLIIQKNGFSKQGLDFWLR